MIFLQESCSSQSVSEAVVEEQAKDAGSGGDFVSGEEFGLNSAHAGFTLGWNVRVVWRRDLG